MNFDDGADHATHALEHVDKADSWANRDNVMPDFRATMVAQELQLAQIHATLAVAQQISMYPGHDG